jgi:hypothetical protein
MPVRTATFGSKVRQINIVPVFDGMRVTVPAGAFNWKGEKCHLVDAFEVDLLSDAEVAMDVTGYIAKDETSGDFVVVLDEVKRDGVDLPFDFRSSADYTLVAKLFRVMLAPASTALDDLDCLIFESVERPVRPEPQVGAGGPREMTQRLLDRIAAKEAKEQEPDSDPQEVPDE